MKSLIVLAIVGVLAFAAFNTWISWDNWAVNIEEQIKAKQEDNEQKLGQYSLRVMETAQIPKMYAADVKELYSNIVTGTFGEGGSEAMFQFIRTANPTLDPSMYSNVQRIMETGRLEFEKSQTELRDLTREYQATLRRVWPKFWLSTLNNFPTINFDDYKLIQSEHSVETYKTGVDKGLKL